MKYGDFLIFFLVNCPIYVLLHQVPDIFYLKCPLFVINQTRTYFTYKKTNFPFSLAKDFEFTFVKNYGGSIKNTLDNLFFFLVFDSVSFLFRSNPQKCAT